MDSRAQELIRQGDNLFSKRTSLLNLWQEIAENFYPQRADFIAKITPGDDLTEHMSNSFPILAHRDMSNAFNTMLRQRGTHWFKISAGREELDEGRSRAWLEWARDLQYRAMYDRASQFVRATKEGDQDFAAFGQTVIQVTTNPNRDTLLYRTHHLRDCAWAENAEGMVDTFHRKWKVTAIDLVHMFGADRVHKTVNDQLSKGKDPYREFECRHIMIPADRLGGDDKKTQREFRFRSYYIDVENQHVIEDVPTSLFQYVVPRWQTVSGSVYAYSPASIAALPDARMIQSMTYTLLDAGEKATQPPLIGQADMVKSDLEVYAGGVTWVDAEYDERHGEALRPIPLDLRGIPLGIDMMRDTKEMIQEAFFLNKISLPPADREMTAYETSQRVQEYIRQALPLFEPMEVEYNGAICEMTFETLRDGFAFGNPDDMPPELKGADVEFKFVSPLQENEDRKNAQVYLESKQLLAMAAEADPSLTAMVDGRQALRDALQGAGVPATWLLDDQDMDEAISKAQEAQNASQLMDMMERGGQVAEQVGQGVQALPGLVEQENAAA